MRNRLFYLIVLLVSAVGALWYFSTQEEEKTLTDRDFKVESVEEVGKIVLTKRFADQSLVLEKIDDRWWVNGEREARANAMANLLTAIQRVQIKSLPPFSQYETLKKDFIAFSIKVEVYDEAGSKLRTYYIGPDNNEGNGTYYMMENAERIYLMSLPVFDGSLRARFDLKESAWWKRRVIEYAPETIQKLTVNYPRQPQESFQLLQNDELLSVEPVNSEVPKITRPFLKERAFEYLKEFRKKGILAYMNDYEGRDSVLQITPFAEIEIITHDADTQQFVLIPATSQDIEGPSSTAQNKYFNYTYWMYDPQKNDLMQAQYFLFKPVFRSYSYFFE